MQNEFSPEHNRAFYILWDAVIDEPWKVPQLIAASPMLVEQTNLCGETVIHWFIVENDFERVKLLHRCGTPIDPHALVDGCAAGHLGMVELLLCWNIKPDKEDCRCAIERYRRYPTDSARKMRNTVRSMRALFRQHGYPLDGQPAE